MTARLPRAVLLLGLAIAGCAAGCAKVEPWTEEARLSPVPSAGSGTLQAGFARVDITPPTGVGLAGNGPEGNRAKGYRMRLYVRALVLEDRHGERLALVSADLPHVSALLHRRVASRTDTLGLGVDRLLLSATHTHSSVGHFYEASAYNESGAIVAGFDQEIVDSLSTRIARALELAVGDLDTARAGWGATPVWGQTRIRSLHPMRRNRPPPTPIQPPPGRLAEEYTLVDPTLTLLRVDRWDRRARVYRPAGAWSVFAMHGTGNTPNSVLLDPDIHGIVARTLERHIDVALNGEVAGRFAPRAVHVFANGAEGDVSPDWPAGSRCDTPRLLTEPRPSGPFGRRLWEFVPPPERELDACRAAARDSMRRVGLRVGTAAADLFDALSDSLRDTLTIDRAFVTLRLAKDAGRLGICPNPLAGMSTFGGAPDARTRFFGWHWLGLFSSGMEEDSLTPATSPPGKCHGRKRLLLGEGAANRIVGSGLPREAQLLVARVGSRLLAGVPAEVTTTAARRMRDSMLAASRGDSRVADAVIVSLANGFMQYVATAEEYSAQFYEGGSTIYGPGEAQMLSRQLGRLSATRTAGDALPATEGIRVKPGGRRKPYRSRGDERPLVESARCSGDTVYARLGLGRAAGWLVRDPSDVGLPLVEIRRVETGSESSAVAAYDDDPDVELHRDDGGGDAPWELRWSAAEPGDYVVRVRGAPGEKTAACEPPGTAESR
jgi:neutral ceramidase